MVLPGFCVYLSGDGKLIKDKGHKQKNKWTEMETVRRIKTYGRQFILAMLLVSSKLHIPWQGKKQAGLTQYVDWLHYVLVSASENIYFRNTKNSI